MTKAPLLLALLLALGPPHQTAPLPDFALENFDGRPLTNAVFKGKRTVVVPTYAKCVFACPIVTLLLAQLDAELGAPDDVQYLHVSIQPTEDTAEEISSHFADHEIDAASDDRWLFANGPPDAIARFLDGAGIEITRTTVETGVIVQHTIRVFVVGPTGETTARFDSYFWNDEEMRHALDFPRDGV
ncbi:MAG: SCO family protein [bacterium]